MIKWNPTKNRVFYKEDKEGNRVYPYPEDDPANMKAEPTEPKEPTKQEIIKQLEDKGIEFDKRMKKDDLLELLKDE